MRLLSWGWVEGRKGYDKYRIHKETASKLRAHPSVEAPSICHPLPEVPGLEVASRLGAALGRSQRPAAFRDSNGAQ